MSNPFPITFIRKATTPARGAGVSSQGASFGTLPAAGNTVLVYALGLTGGGNTIISASCSDNQGNTYATDFPAYGYPGIAPPGRQPWVALFRASNIGAPSGTFNITVNAVQDGTGVGVIEVVAVEVQNLVNTSPLEAVEKSTVLSTNNSPVGPITTTYTYDFLWTGFSTDEPANISVPAGFTFNYLDQDPSWTAKGTAYQIVSSPQNAITPTWSVSLSFHFVGLIAAYKGNVQAVAPKPPLIVFDPTLPEGLTRARTYSINRAFTVQLPRRTAPIIVASTEERRPALLEGYTALYQHAPGYTYIKPRPDYVISTEERPVDLLGTGQAFLALHGKEDHPPFRTAPLVLISTEDRSPAIVAGQAISMHGFTPAAGAVAPTAFHFIASREEARPEMGAVLAAHGPGYAPGAVTATVVVIASAESPPQDMLPARLALYVHGFGASPPSHTAAIVIASSEAPRPELLAGLVTTAIHGFGSAPPPHTAGIVIASREEPRPEMGIAIAMHAFRAPRAEVRTAGVVIARSEEPPWDILPGRLATTAHGFAAAAVNPTMPAGRVHMAWAEPPRPEDGHVLQSHGFRSAIAHVEPCPYVPERATVPADSRRRRPDTCVR